MLHSDSSENLHCVVSGQKRFVIIDPKYASNIGQEYFTKGYFDVDVDKLVSSSLAELRLTPLVCTQSGYDSVWWSSRGPMDAG